ncbi:hypothetical protein VUR80DRAFT_5622 [Thermomyces stellatus]
MGARWCGCGSPGMGIRAPPIAGRLGYVEGLKRRQNSAGDTTLMVGKHISSQARTCMSMARYICPQTLLNVWSEKCPMYLFVMTQRTDKDDAARGHSSFDFRTRRSLAISPQPPILEPEWVGWGRMSAGGGADDCLVISCVSCHQDTQGIPE